MRKLLFALVLLSALALQPVLAAHAEIQSPVQTVVEAASAQPVDLGVVGPGQKLEIIVSTDTGEVSKNGTTLSRKEALWSLLQVQNDSLPAGWQGQDSLLYDSPMKAFVVVSKDAPDGEYSFSFQLSSQFEPIAPLSFKATAQVRKDVLAMGIVQDPVKVESNSVGSYQLELNNLASANDVYAITVSGLPQALDQSKQKTVFVPFESKATVDIPITAPEGGEFPITFTATSLSSPAITARAQTTLFAGSSLASDLKAAERGVLLFPTAAAPIYSLLSLLSSLLMG